MTTHTRMHAPILPGATIGILGGGQLGRMTGMAARSMGYDIHVLDPDEHCAARAIASRTITAPFNDPAAAAELARHCAVVTLEIEQISVEALEAAARHAPLHPGVAPVFVIQDRVRQKSWLAEQHFPVGPFHAADSADDIANAVREMGPSIAKSCHGGYDGRGQVRMSDASTAAAAWSALGQRQCLVEQRVDIALELSVLVARNASGATAVYPAARNHHTQGILTWSVIPSAVSDDVVQKAMTLAESIAVRLDIVGLLAVELFWTTGGELLVNELAPRPHNTYHHSERACVTSQFEQLVRAVCNLPLGATDVLRPGAIVNLLGEVWLQESPPGITRALSVPSSRLHLYGKASARAGRKMGHLSSVGASSQEALSRVLESYRQLSPDTARQFGVTEAAPVLTASS